MSSDSSPEATLTPEVQLLPEDVEMSPAAPRAGAMSDTEAEVEDECIMVESPEDEVLVTLSQLSVEAAAVKTVISTEVTDRFANCVVVLDTNVLVSEEGRRFVDLFKYDTAVCARTVFKVPYVVLNELDTLKTKRIRGELSEVARGAISAASFLRDRLMQGDKRFAIQSSMDDNKKAMVRMENNDDRILNCCLQTMETFGSSKPVYFVTNDINLQLKAFANQICRSKILSSAQLVCTIEKLKSFKEQNRAKQHLDLLFPVRKSVQVSEKSTEQFTPKLVQID